MKKLVLLTALLVATSIAQAHPIKISVENRSDSPITIRKSDGYYYIPAHTIIYNQKFDTNETLTNHVDGRFKCTWDLHERFGQHVTGIFYSTDPVFTPGCVVIVTP